MILIGPSALKLAIVPQPSSPNLVALLSSKKNEAKAFIEDGYLDVEESQQLVSMMKDFADKCSDVEDVVSFTEEEDSKVYKQLENILHTTQKVYVEVLRTSAKACEDRAKVYEKAAQEVEPLHFGRYVLLHLLWMPRYARGGEKKIGWAIFLNILDLVTLTFVFTRSILLILALVTYPKESKERKESQEKYKALAQQERDRAKAYHTYVKTTANKTPAV
ncbi:hypothetical protein LB450_06500 [Psychroflexus sp. CAK1W]|uniref:hypothetical protein n=1 Tax=Psychroflexus curvus TaxID=2873595 RepID=UPI001CCD6C6B|nr:hypothetical protein [Psychroflexus curvus]MBZ9627747.1 hypothetical protein [Psychroflexus curvus]